MAGKRNGGLPDGQRRCSRCKIVKTEEDFYWRNKVEQRYRMSICKTCTSETHKETYTGERAERMRQQNVKARARVRAFLAEKKDVPCADCGGRFPVYVMDFDHRDPKTKLFGLGGFPKHDLVKIAAEIEKCDVVCANCHRIRTFGKR